MVDPFAITDFDRSDADLQEFWLFCVSVAGKKATVIAGKIREFLESKRADETPFDYVRRLLEDGSLGSAMRAVRLGKYDLLGKSWALVVGVDAPDLRTAEVLKLQEIHGVGFKTSRFFVLHSRRSANVAVIDTHVLKYLKSRHHRVPKTIPVGAEYLRLEKLMLSYARAAGMPMADFDLAIWKHYASKGIHPLPTSVLVRDRYNILPSSESGSAGISPVD
jgi:thermostable 8-oxoguanine DNA glycosylase